MSHVSVRLRGIVLSLALMIALLITAAAGAWAPAGSVFRANVAYDGGLANGESAGGLAVSSDGRYVAFVTVASNILQGDTNLRYDVFRRDLVSQETTLVSVTMAGGFSAQGALNYLDMTPDGRYVLFASADAGLVSGDTNGAYDVFVRDMASRETTLVSTTSDGTQANWNCTGDGSLSDDGSKVAYSTDATNLYPDDVNGRPDVIMKNLESGEATCVSRGYTGAVGNGHSFYATISGDGTKVAFLTYATNMVPDDVSSLGNLFLRDVATGEIERVDATTAGGESATDPAIALCDLDYTGRYVAFTSWQTDIVDGPVGVHSQVYVRDTESDETTVVARAYDDNPANDRCYAPSISSDGRWVSFVGQATNLVTDDTNAVVDVFLRDMQADTIERISLNGDGEELDKGTYEQALGADGTVVAFNSFATNILEPFGNGLLGHIYVRILQDSDPVLPPVIPISGGTRFQTAVATSEEAYPAKLDPLGARTVIIATGRNWPDALGGSSLAGVLDGPILLVDTASVPASVTAEITRLGADKAIILGGTGAVGASVEAALKLQLGAGDVDRIAGGSRYATADLIAERVIELKGPGYDGTAFVATGGKFPDALGAAPLAAANGWPLYLVNPLTGISDETYAAMGQVTDVLVLGGTSAVSSAVYDELVDTYGVDFVERLTGEDRYDTAVTVAEWGVANANLSWNRVALATGTNFPDALAGGVLQGKVGSVLLLTRPEALNSYAGAALSANKADITTVTYFGGFGAVSQTVRDSVTAALMP